MANLFAPLQPIQDPLCRLVLGTSFGGRLQYSEAVRLFDSYVALGGNCFDTALVYYDSETMLGRWMRERGCRSKTTIIAKIAHPENDVSRVSPESIRADLQRTLESLGTDYVDILMLHRDDPSRRVGPILEELNRLRQAGTIRAYAASNWTIDRLEAAQQFAGDHDLKPFCASSVYFGLASPREMPWPGCVSANDPSSQAWYEQTQMPLLAWSALGFGYFAQGDSRLRLNSGTPQDSTGVNFQRVFGGAVNGARLARAIDLGLEKGFSATQIALAWLLHQPQNVFAVAGPRNETEVAQLFEAFAIALSSDEVASLRGPSEP